MFPRILGKFRQKEAPVDPTAGSAPGDEGEAADSGTTSDPVVFAPADRSPQGPRRAEAPEKDRVGAESMYPEDWGKKFECIGELVVERKAEPSDVVKIYQTLSESLQAEIFYVNPSHRGTSIVCGITDAALFIAALPKMPRVASWALTHR